MPTFSERLANLSLPSVILIVAVLFALRYVLVRQKSPGARSTAEIVESLLIAVSLVFLVIKPFIVQTFFIPSESMVPTLQISDKLFVDKFTYRFAAPKHGDIVVFKAPYSATDGQDRDFIKRLIGLPGDVLQVKVEGSDPRSRLPFGTLYVNGKRAEEPYVNEQHHILCNSVRTDPQDKFHPSIDLLKPYKVPAGRYFMMGDNRNNSDDSRYWGPLDRNRVIGRALVRFWPVHRATVFH